MKPFQTRGAAVLVTGASAGIGRSTAVALEKAGAVVALAARRLDRVQELRATFQFPGEHLPIAMDVADPGSVERGFQQIEAKYGKLDGMVANAGVGAWYNVHETPEDEARRVLDTNVLGVIRCIRYGVPLIRKGGGGTIVLVSSVVGRRGSPGMGVYSASKFALHGLADAMRIELAPDNIDVSVICPGLTRTEFFDKGTGQKGIPPNANEGDSAEGVAAAIVSLLGSGKPEIHRTSALSPKRYAGIVTQLFPRLVDKKMIAYYQKRRASSES